MSFDPFRDMPRVSALAYHLLHLDHPRPLQLAVAPLLLAGRNLLIAAATGSGKTGAVFAPLAERILQEGDQELYLLYLCPTKALVNDLYVRLGRYGEGLGIRLARRTGDHNEFIDRRPAQVVLATPESLDILLSTERHGGIEERVRSRLRQVRAVVVDEVHQFYRTPRGLQLLALLERLKRLAGRPLQRIALSATVPDLEGVAGWLRGSDGPMEVIQDQGFIRNLEIQVEYAREPADLVGLCLRRIARGEPKLLLFANSRIECDQLVLALSASPVLAGRVLLHYSTLGLETRHRTEGRFREAESAICVATSTLEVGIDIGDIDRVLLWGPPGNAISFLQRLGRGNRRRGTICALAICREEQRMEDLFQFLALVGLAEDGRLEQPADPRYYSVVAQQALSVARRHKRIAPEPLLAIFQDLLPGMGEPEGTEILKEMAAQHLLRPYHGSHGVYPLGPEGHQRIDRRQIYTNFATPDERWASLVTPEGEILAQLPLTLNRRLLYPGSCLLCAGGKWEVLEVLPEQAIVRVAPAPPEAPARQPIWGNRAIPISFSVAQEMARLCAGRRLSTSLTVSPRLRNLARWVWKHFGEAEGALLVGRHGGVLRYYTWLGTAGHYLLQLLLPGVVLDFDGVSVYTSSDCPPLPDLLPATPDEVLAALGWELEGLKELFCCSRHLDSLPPDLQRAELLSSFEAGMLEGLVALRERPIVPLST